MVGSETRSRKRKPAAAAWLSVLLRSEFFVACVDHEGLKKNDKNLFCIDCRVCLCKEYCLTMPLAPSSDSSCSHQRRLQIYKYVFNSVVRVKDIQSYGVNCSRIQQYTINKKKAVHLNPRGPQQKDAKKSPNPKAKGGGSGTCCEACGWHIQGSSNRFCSIACKVSAVNDDDIIDGSKEGQTDDPSNLERTTEEINYSSSYEIKEYSESSEVIQTPSTSAQRMAVLHRRKSSAPRRGPTS